MGRPHRRFVELCIINSRFSTRLAAVGLLGCLLIAGCGSREYDVAPVAGRVTLDGKPIADILVSFQPVAVGRNDPNPGPGSTGRTDAQGRFTLQVIEPEEPGAVVGKHIVRLTTAYEETDPADDTVSIIESILPASCLDGSMTFTVESGGTDEANFDVQSR